MMGSEAHNQATMFSGERIWKRQRPRIERMYRRSAPRLELRVKQLRDGIQATASKTDREKCVFETNFDALLRARGDEEEAQRMVRNRTLTPYSHCDTWSRYTDAATRPGVLVGFGALLLGTFSLVRSRKKPDPATAQPPQASGRPGDTYL